MAIVPGALIVTQTILHRERKKQIVAFSIGTQPARSSRVTGANSVLDGGFRDATDRKQR
jgi:hypothetical protein